MKSFACVFAFLFSVTLFAPQQAALAQEDSKAPGQVAFDRVCKVCHGPEGNGDAAPRLVPFARDYEEVLAIVRDGDIVSLDVANRTIELQIDADEFRARMAALAAAPQQPSARRGYARLYRDTVMQADDGADFDFLAGP